MKTDDALGSMPDFLKHLMQNSMYVTDSAGRLLYAPKRLLDFLQCYHQSLDGQTKRMHTATQLESMLIDARDQHRIQAARAVCQVSNEVISISCRAHTNLPIDTYLTMHMMQGNHADAAHTIVICISHQLDSLCNASRHIPAQHAQISKAPPKVLDVASHHHHIGQPKPNETGCSAYMPCFKDDPVIGNNDHGFIAQKPSVKMRSNIPMYASSEPNARQTKTSINSPNIPPSHDHSTNNTDDHLNIQQQLQDVQNENAALIQSCQMKNHLLNELAHDLRTPLSAIKGFSELMLEDRMGPLPQKQKQYLQQIKDNSAYMLELVNQTLGFLKASQHQSHVQPKVLCLNRFLHEMKLGIEPLLQKKGIQLLITAYKPMPRLMLNALKLRQILHNVLHNAIKYSPIKSTIVIAYHWRDGTLQLAIQDRGYGVTKKTQKQLFESFFAVQPKTHRHDIPSEPTIQHDGMGVGLGLYLCRLLVASMEGSIDIQSDGIDQGTTVHICFRQVPTAQETLHDNTMV